MKLYTTGFCEKSGDDKDEALFETDLDLSFPFSPIPYLCLSS
jgi:hypothetical protein